MAEARTPYWKARLPRKEVCQSKVKVQHLNWPHYRELGGGFICHGLPGAHCLFHVVLHTTSCISHLTGTFTVPLEVCTLAPFWAMFHFSLCCASGPEAVANFNWPQPETFQPSFLPTSFFICCKLSSSNTVELGAPLPALLSYVDLSQI